MQLNVTRKYASGSETIILTDIVLVDGIDSIDVSILGSVVNQQAAFLASSARCQSAFIGSIQPCTVALNGLNAQQTVTIGGGTTGGTFTLSYGGQTTAAIAWNATAAVVQAALAALSSIGTAQVIVTGSAGGPWTVQFCGTLGGQVISAMTYSTASLTGGTPTITIATVVVGAAGYRTLTFGGSVALDWALADGFFSNPITTDITSLLVTNLGPTSTVVQVRIGQRGT